MEQKIKEIQTMVKDLLSEKARLETDHQQVLEELSQCKDKLLDSEREVKTLRRKVELSEMSGSLGAKGENTALKSKIDKFIGEIDRCLELMKKE